MGSYVSIVAIAIALGAGRLAEWLGTPDAPWVAVVEWVGIAIFVGDIFRSLMRLTPRKRWERVMYFGLAIGGGLLFGTAVIWYDSRVFRGDILTVGLFTVVVAGLGGWLMWRRELQRLQSRILERALKRKKRNYGV